MAKKQKSKLLAMALCASVMAGLYANPVFAGPVEINYDADKGGIYFDFANTAYGEGADGLYAMTIGGEGINPGSPGSDTYEIGAIKGQFTISSTSIAQALNNQTIENLTINNLNGFNVADLSNLGGIKREDVQNQGTVNEKGRTVVEGILVADSINGYIANTDATFIVDRNGHIKAGNLKANGRTGGWYVEDIALGNDQYKTMIYAASEDGASTLRIDPENGNTSTKGTIGVGANLDQPYTQINGAHDANVGDIALGIQYDGAGKVTGQNILLDASEGHITAKGSVYAADFNGVSIEKDGDNTLINGVDINGAAGDISALEHLTQNINAEETKPGETVFNGIVSADEIKTNNNRFWVDDEGNMSLTNGTAGVNTGTNLVEINTVNNTVVTNNNGTTFTNKEDGSTTVIHGNNITSGAVNADTLNGKNINEIFNNIEDSTGDISDLQKKTQNMWADKNYTTFKGSLSTEGNLSVGNGAAQLKGNWGQEASLELRDGNDKTQTLYASQLENINNVIKESGNVVGTTVKTTSGADLDTVAQNTQHITHDEQGTHIEGMTIQQGDPGANLSGIYTINGASFEATNQNGGIKISGVTLEQGGINAYAPSNVGGVTFDGYGSMNNVNNINGVNFNELAQTVEGSSTDVQHIKHYDDYAINGKGYDATVIEESVAITKDRGVDVIGGNGASVATITRQGNARFGAETGANVRIQDGGVYVNENYQNTVASLTAEGLTLGEQTLTEQKISDIEGITRDAETGTTTIEGATSFDENGMNVGNGAVVANTDGSFSAANGAFDVAADGTLTISNANDPLGDKTEIGAGYITMGDTNINGFGIETPYIEAQSAEIGGVKLDGGLVDGVDVGDLDATVNGRLGGIERVDSDNDGDLDTTIIEDSLSANVSTVNMFGENGLDFTYGVVPNGEAGVNVTGNMHFASGSDVTFNYDGTKYDNKSYSLNDLVDGINDLNGRVDVLEDKTTGITYDEVTGSTTITDQVGTDGVQGNSSITVGNDGVAINGDTTVSGTGSVDGSLTVEGENGNTSVVGDEITTGTVNGTVGNFTESVIVGGENGTSITGGTIETGETTIDGSGMIVGAGESATSITNDTVKAENGDFGNLTADKGTFGGEGGTYIDKDSVSIADSTIISDHDVVINEGTDERVSLADVGNRVGNLEQGLSDLNSRVDKLDDRIDKVGAMAAAIANLRTMGYDPAAPTEVAVGLGQYRDETGAALGLFHYPNRDFMLSLSVSTSGDEVMGGIGATWKFGRKSPEKVAEIKKAQAEADVRRAEAQKLAKAEELKAAAKEAKIKAQMERHAKLAAERAAEAEAK